MVKLQKIDHSQNRPSDQSALSGLSNIASTRDVTPQEQESGTKVPPLRAHQSGRTMPPSSWHDNQQVSSQHRNFSHCPSSPEPSFVATGREQFLKRASIIARTKVKRGYSSSPGPNTRNAVSETRPVLTVSSHCSNHRSLMPIEQESVAVLKAQITSTDGTSKMPSIHKKRSMSLPALTSRHKEEPTPTKVSFSPFPAIHTFNPDDATAQTDQLPFTPKVDLESMFDNVSASYNERLAEAQRRSSMLWRKDFANQREENREAGVLRKRRDRRMSSPAPVKPTLSSSYATPYKDTKPGVQPRIVGSLHTVLSPKGIVKPEKVSAGIDLSSNNLIHPAFRTVRPNIQMADLQMEHGFPISIIKDEITSSDVCLHCGHAQNSSQTSPSSPSPPSINSEQDAGKIQAVELEAPNPRLLKGGMKLPSTDPVHIPSCTPTEVSIAERSAAARALLLLTSSQESVNSSRTFVDVTNTEKAPAYGHRNKSESDFHSLTTKDGWPLRMTNWKGPFAAHARKPATSPENHRVQHDKEQSAPKNQNRTSSRPRFADHLPSEEHESTTRRGRSLRRLTIESTKPPIKSRFREEELLGPPEEISINYTDRECRSPSIYSIDIPSPLSPSSDEVRYGCDYEDEPWTSASPYDANLQADKEDLTQPDQTGASLGDRGTLTVSTSIISRSVDRNLEAVNLGATITHPIRSVQNNLDPTEYSLDISRSAKRSSWIASSSSETPQGMQMPESAHHTTPQLELHGSKEQISALHGQSRKRPQSLNQFRNNCRPIEQVITPITARHSPKLSSKAQRDHGIVSHHKPQTIDQSRTRRRLSKARPDSCADEHISQNHASDRSSSIAASQSSKLDELVPTKPLKPRLKQQQPQKPEIPPRTKAVTPSTTAKVNEERSIEERQPRSRMPPNSFPTQKSRAENEGGSRTRSRSRSRIRSMLQTIGLASKENDADSGPVKLGHNRETGHTRLGRLSTQFNEVKRDEQSEGGQHEYTKSRNSKASSSNTVKRGERRI